MKYNSKKTSKSKNKKNLPKYANGGSTGKSILGAAASGAGMGAMFGPVGAGIGAGAGALLGLGTSMYSDIHGGNMELGQLDAAAAMQKQFAGGGSLHPGDFRIPINFLKGALEGGLHFNGGGGARGEFGVNKEDKGLKNNVKSSLSLNPFEDMSAHLKWIPDALKSMPMFKAYGGSIPKFNEGGDLTEYEGLTHDQGGLPLGNIAEVEAGETRHEDYIFSDRIKVPGTKRTFADESKKIEKKYAKRDNDKLSDEAKKIDLKRLEESQEAQRAKMVKSTFEKAFGGGLPKYFTGGPFDGDDVVIPGIVKQPTEIDAATVLGDSPEEMMTFKESLDFMNHAKTIDKDVNPALENNKSYEGKINPWLAGAQGLGYLHQLSQGLKGGDPVNFQRAKYRETDPRPSLDAAASAINQQGNALSKDIRDNSNNSGSYLASRIAAGSRFGTQGGEQAARIRQHYDDVNSQLYGNNQQVNAQIQMREADARQQEQDAARSAVTSGLSGLGSTGANIQKDMSYNEVQNMIVKAMQTGNYKLAQDLAVAFKQPKQSAAYGGKIKGRMNKYKKC